ncbi:ABC transporter permease [Gordonia sp. NPDC003376]
MGTDTVPTTPTTPSVQRRTGPRLPDSLKSYLGVSIMLVVLVVYLSITSPAFATPENIMAIFETNAVLLVVGVGLTFVLIGGGFDLSVGAMLALSGILMAQLVTGGMSYWIAGPLVIVGAAILGALVNGSAIGRMGLSFFVVTLGTMSIFRGAAQLTTEGHSVDIYDVPGTQAVGSGKLASIPWLVVIALAVLVVGYLVLRYTGFGRMLYAVGGNPEAARLAGIRVPAIQVATYGICAGTAALAGVMEASRLGTASPTAGVGMELVAASAVLLGGTSFSGGSGGVIGTLLGTLFLGVISNGLTISQVSSFWQGVVTGIVLLAAVALDRLRHIGFRIPGLARGPAS